MGNHQGLHGGGVFLHQVADARVGIDDNFICQAHVAAPVFLLGGDELFAVAPMAVVDRHANRSVGVHHLFGGDYFQLVGVSVQPKALGGLTYHLVVAVDQLKRPIARVGQRCGGALRGWERFAQKPAGSAVARGGNTLQVFSSAPLQNWAHVDGHGVTPSFLKRSRNTG